MHEPDPPPASPPPCGAARRHLAPGQLLLVYTPDGPVGGTFTCTGCRAQAWQPDLLAHAPDCPFPLRHPMTPR